VTERNDGRQARRRRLWRMVVVLLWACACLLLIYQVWLWGLALSGVALAVSLGLAVRTVSGRFAVAVNVRGPSMEPSYHDGDAVLVRRNVVPVVGQVVVVEWPLAGTGWDAGPLPRHAGQVAVRQRRWLVKRVAAVSGDPVRPGWLPDIAVAPDGRVPPGKLVLLGDNDVCSVDSRTFGYYPADRVLGVVLRVVSRSADSSR
jgi:signal peptidase I